MSRGCRFRCEAVVGERPISFERQARNTELDLLALGLVAHSLDGALLHDTQRVMSEESATHSPAELVRNQIEALKRRDFDAAMSFWGSDPVWDMSPMGLGMYEGAGAIRRFLEDWTGSYEEWENEPEEVRDLGNGVVVAVFLQAARPVGSRGHVQLRYASVSDMVEGLFVRITNYSDIDEARVAAERLAESRG
jgi:ketosteroid isomerase-like protein